MRSVLPPRRHCVTFPLQWWGQRWNVTIGYYADRVTPGEVFVNGGKSGVDTESMARDSAILLSLAMQHGVSLETIGHAITRNGDGTPSTIIGAIVDRLTGQAGMGSAA